MRALGLRHTTALLAIAATSGACHESPAAIVGVSAPRATERTVRTVDAGVPEPSPVPDDFRSRMTKMGDRFLSQGHGQRFDAVVWANATAAPHWDTPEQMLEGAMLVEEVILKESGGDRPGGLLVMEKAGGGWRFAAVTPEGDVVRDARVAACESCHREAESSVFKKTRPKSP
jgi:hypothetical protein